MQADDSAKVVDLEDTNNNGTFDFGEKFCVQTECFYVISNDNGNLEL